MMLKLTNNNLPIKKNQCLLLQYLNKLNKIDIFNKVLNVGARIE